MNIYKKIRSRFTMKCIGLVYQEDVTNITENTPMFWLDCYDDRWISTGKWNKRILFNIGDKA
jgi:hypothetical protein